MKKQLLLSCLLVSAFAANAQVAPKAKPETLVAGKQYVLVNRAQSATQYMSRTSWDGALYFLGESDSKYANHAFTAVLNSDDTWSFTIPSTETVETGEYNDNGEPITEVVPVTLYMGIPAGTDNLNIKTKNPVAWTVTASEDYEGFYRLTAGNGNNENCVGRQLHLNAGVQYFVISEPVNGGSWYPDYAGGATLTGEYDDNDEEIIIINDYTSFNWGFLQVENVPAYYADLKYSGAINKFHADYCDMEDYGEGFLATYQAVAKLYNEAEDADALEEAGILDMMNAKVALYEEIEAAIMLNEDDNAVLAAAIATAQNVFKTQTAAAEVGAATQTLKQAETDYSLGTGDITSLGANMSFEDLSAQGGAPTSGSGPAPAGWNVYINGTQQEAGANVTSFPWHGVNADAEGEPMDGNYAFGLWVQAVPTYEISQTIEGLETGTYEITAGLMAGAQGGNLRITTQRIFGNLNSTYFAGEEAYNLDELDDSEVYDFAGNDPTVNTDRILYPVTVNAFVYDGTLTFGVRTDGNTAAAIGSVGTAGSGWFKVDNFHITKLGYKAEDAVSIYNHYAEKLDWYIGAAMYAELADELEETDLEKVNENSTQAEIVESIIAAKELLARVSASVKAYQKLEDAINTHLLYLEQYAYKAGAGEYEDAINEAADILSEGTAKDEAEVDEIIAKLEAALQECIQSDDIEEGDDLTEYIQNPSFEDLSAQNNMNSDGIANAPKGWSLYVDGEPVNSVAEAGVSGWCAINSGDNIDVTNTQGENVTRQYTDGEHLWGLWSNAVPVIELSQTIEGLPSGTYTLTADIVVQNDWAGMNLGMQRLFANDYVALFGAEGDYIQNMDKELYETFPEDVRIAAEIDALNEGAAVHHLNYADNYSHESYGASGAPYTTAVVFGLAEKGDVTFGFRSSRISAADGMLSGQASMGWFKIDNFRLVFESADVPAGAETTAEATGIDAVRDVNTAPAEFYTLDGVRLAAPRKGINIVRMNGVVSKVFVK